MQPDTIRLLLNRAAPVVAILFVTAIICATQLKTDLWLASRVDKFIRYPYLLEAFRNAVDSGTFYPRWLSGLYGGYGYPTFLLYQPGYWFFSLPFTYLTDRPDVAVKLSNTAQILIATSGYYCLARFFGNTRLASAGLMLAAILNSIWFKAAFVSLGSSMRLSYIFAIWGIYCFLLLNRRISAGQSASWIFPAWCAATTAVLYTHPFNAGFYTVLSAALALGFFINATAEHRKSLLAAIFFGGMICLLLASPYWFTAWYFSDKVEYSRALRGVYTPYLYLMNNRDWSSFLFWRLKPLAHFAMIESLIYLLIACAALSLRKERWLWPMMALYAVTIFLMLPASYLIWKHAPFLHYLQTPQRLRYLAYLIEYLFVAMAAVKWYQMCAFPRLAVTAISAALLVCCLWVYQYNAASGHVAYEPRPIPYERWKQALEYNSFLNFQEADEFRPETASTEGLKNRYAAKIPIMELVVLSPGKAELTITSDDTGPLTADLVVAQMPQQPIKLRINQFYFPGWEVTVNDEIVPPDSSNFRVNPKGFMVLLFNEPGTYHITARYAGPPYWSLRNLLIAFAVPLLLYGYFCYCRKGTRTNETNA